MSLLDHPEAQALLADAVVSPDDVRGCCEHLTGFLQRYLPLFAREEQRGHARAFVRGLLSGLERKSIEPIAARAGIPRKNPQHFVGAGTWGDATLTAELRRHVAEELGDPEGIIVLDPSGFPKKGQDSCGVARRWCGRLGKKDNCQLGVFLAYVSARGHAPLDARLYLPKDWANAPERRQAAHVPEEVTYRTTWQIAHELLRRCGPDVPHGWVTGDDEFGRASKFRDRLRADGERYVLDVPCDTTVRGLDRRRPPAARVAAAPGVRSPSCGSMPGPRPCRRPAGDARRSATGPRARWRSRRSRPGFVPGWDGGSARRSDFW